MTRREYEFAKLIKALDIDGAFDLDAKAIGHYPAQPVIEVLCETLDCYTDDIEDTIQQAYRAVDEAEK